MTTNKRPLSTLIARLDLSDRAFKLLQAWLGSAATLGDLVTHEECEVADAPGIGPKVFDEIVIAVRATGRKFTTPVYECCNWCRHWNWQGNRDSVCNLFEANAEANTDCAKFESLALSAAEILQRTEAIAKDPGDDVEQSHIDEDLLYHDFVRSLATRRDDVGRRARLILQTRLLRFARYCA